MTLFSFEDSQGATKTHLLHMSTENSGNSENIANIVGIGIGLPGSWFRKLCGFWLGCCFFSDLFNEVLKFHKGI